MPPKKNPVKPKGKMTAYAFFVNACRLEHHNQFPGQKIKLSEFSTVCAKRWKEMTMDQKRPFAEMADRDKMRYENELKLLFPGENTPKRRRKKKDPNAPKKNLSPFFIFSKMKRPEIMKDHPSKGVGEISKVLSAEWSNMSEEDKSLYVRMSEEDKVRYQKQLEQYKETGTVVVGNTMMAVAAVVGDEEEDEEEDEDDEFSFPGGHSTSSTGVPMTSAQTFQGQQSLMAGNSGPASMVTSTVQQASSQSSVNNQQFANGQAQMYQQQGMMMQPQGNMMGGQPQQMNQFNTGNNQMQQMMQPQQNQQMQGQMHPNFTSQSNHQQFMTPAQPQQARMMQSGPQQMQQPTQQMTTVATTSQNPQQQQQYMMSMSNGPRGNTSQFSSQPQMMMQQQQNQQIHQQQNSVDVQQQQMHANQLMQQAAVFQQQNPMVSSSNVQTQQLASSQSQLMVHQSNPVDEMKPSIQEMSESDSSSNAQNMRHPNMNGPTPPPITKEDKTSADHFASSELASQQDMNGQSANSAVMTDRLNPLVKERQTPPTSENMASQNQSSNSSGTILEKSADSNENSSEQTALMSSI